MGEVLMFPSVVAIEARIEAAETGHELDQIAAELDQLPTFWADEVQLCRLDVLVARRRRALSKALANVRFFDGQRYVEAGRFERRRRDGTMAMIIAWRSHCAECGEDFTFTTPATASKFQPNRRCAKHKRPGRRVGGCR